MNEPAADYRVELDNFSGPLDLLLYLIRREEVDLFNIPVAHITEQYVKYLDLMQEMNINVAGEFIVMAATLIEIKSRMMTPEPEAMPEEEEGDPRLELVRQLMAYKRFKEAALALTERAEVQSERFARPGERPADGRDLKAETPAGVSMWALLEAFNKVLDQTGSKPFHRLVLDNMPQEQIKADLEERVRVAGRISFLKVFEGQVTRPRLMGTFLALLELVKQQVMRADQEESFGEIWISYVPPEEREPDLPEPAAAATPSAADGPSAPPEGALIDMGEPDEEWPEPVSEITLPDVPEVPDAPSIPSSSPAPADEGDPSEEEELDDEEDEFDDEDEEDEDEDEDDDE